MRTIKVDGILPRPVEMRSLTTKESRAWFVKVKEYFLRLNKSQKATIEKLTEDAVISFVDLGIEFQDEICQCVMRVTDITQPEIDNMDWDEVSLLWPHFRDMNKTFLKGLASLGLALESKPTRETQAVKLTA